MTCGCDSRAKRWAYALLPGARDRQFVDLLLKLRRRVRALVWAVVTWWVVQ